MPKEDAPAAAIAQRENLAVRDQLRSTDIVPAAKRADVFNPKSYDEALKMAREVAQSDFVPKAYSGKPGNVLVAWQMGAELGLKPMQAVQNIAVINGQPGLWGDAVPALIMAQPDFIDMIESWEGGTAKCTMKRKDRADVTREFSDADVTKAQLGGKDTYVKYGKRMKQMRARAWAARDMWADVLKGLGVVEEIMTNEIDVTPNGGQETVAGLSERTAARAAQTSDGRQARPGRQGRAGRQRHHRRGICGDQARRRSAAFGQERDQRPDRPALQVRNHRGPEPWRSAQQDHGAFRRGQGARALPLQRAAQEDTRGRRARSSRVTCRTSTSSSKSTARSPIARAGAPSWKARRRTG
jgi:hypothetical protein